MAIYRIAPEIEDYFEEQYENCGIKVVPGHWPEMKTKEDVDKWISGLKMIAGFFTSDESEGDEDE